MYKHDLHQHHMHPHHMHPHHMHPHHTHPHHHHKHMPQQYSQPSKEVMYKKCREHMHRYVLVHTHEGHSYDGFVEHVDEENLYLAVFVDLNDRMGIDQQQMREDNQGGVFGKERQVWGYSGYGYPGYGYGYPGYGYYGYGRPRRFRRLTLPLATLTALSLLPFY